MKFDLAMTDELLATTRAVRKRLDLDRKVPREVIMECLELAVQAPTGSNSQGWRWLVVDDPKKKKALADLYRKGGEAYLSQAGEAAQGSRQRADAARLRVGDVSDRHPAQGADARDSVSRRATRRRAPQCSCWRGYFGSIFPAVWSFQLAARSRGLGTVLTTLHLIYEKEAAEILGVPDNVMQVALLPVAYTKGTDFKRAERPPVSNITHWNTW